MVSACHLADAATPTAWSTGAAEDALDAIGVLGAALSRISPETAGALAAVAAATTAARRHLALPADPDIAPASGAAGGLDAARLLGDGASDGLVRSASGHTCVRPVCGRWR